MNKIFTLLMCLLALTLDAQEIDIPTSITVSEQLQPLDEQQCNAFTLNVQGDAKDVKKSFKEFLEDRYALELKGIGSTLKGEALSNSRISDKVFNFVFVIKENGMSNALALYMRLSNGEYVSSEKYADESDVLEHLLKDFAKSFYADIVNERIEEKTDELEKLNKERKKDVSEQASLAKEISKNEKKIAKYESKVSKAQLKIEKYQEEIKSEEEEIAQNTQEVEEIKAENSKTEAKKTEVETDLETNNNLISEKSKELKALQSKLSQLLSF
ncbi:hypothetical protein SAMN05216474_0649 [Lishizhenia tianjinensis]|uniref:Uncharacterized protein n=1 Tax=Lishizhenia tianjinensis TaxID=477690 RepID=A0A1I6Y503_9FLAO|nr:hypothetical protein [Lishizhenia tianjinensis]SFT45321.1 hypothetical protein SAMN05216474_0649 [Lishizhenia tianjinensis]